MTHPSLSLKDFRGDGYERGRSVIVQIAWLAVRGPLSMWCVPAALRVKVLRMFGAEIGDGVLIRHGVRIHWPWKLSVGDNCWIGESAWILNLEPISLASNVCVSQGVLLCSGSHQRMSPTFEFDNGEIEIKDRVWVGARAVVLRGVVLGERCVVGANVVVAKDLEAGAVVVAPSRQVHVASED